MIVFNRSVVVSIQANMIPGTTLRLHIYDGAIPTVDGAFIFNPANYSPLATISSMNGSPAPNAVKRQFAVPSTAPKGLRAGKATWFVLYDLSNPALALLGTVTTDPAIPAAMLLSNDNIEINVDVGIVEIAFTINP